MYRVALDGAGFLVQEAGDGLGALKALESGAPDLIVLDLGLPDIGGLTVLQEVAAQARTREIPILVVTGSTLNLADLQVACVLKKPASPQVLVTAVQNCLSSGDSGDPTG